MGMAFQLTDLEPAGASDLVGNYVPAGWHALSKRVHGIPPIPEAAVEGLRSR